MGSKDKTSPFAERTENTPLLKNSKKKHFRLVSWLYENFKSWIF